MLEWGFAPSPTAGVACPTPFGFLRAAGYPLHPPVEIRTTTEGHRWMVLQTVDRMR
jgi:hypothetical protein